MDTAATSLEYNQALGYLYGRINYERSGNIPYRSGGFRLDRMRHLLSRLDHPEANLRIIHVAGTKGKGSTSAMIAAALQHSGLRTGLYTSPHLERLEERFVMNDQCCSAAELVHLVDQVEPIVTEMDREESSRGGRGPTFFEITTAMGLLYFAKQHAEAVVLEVGLGGRLDSTNVCQPQITVITSISFDHTRQLGNTLAKIAREKAGIVKSGIPVVSGVLQPEPKAVIESVASQLQAPLYQLGADFHATYHPHHSGWYEKRMPDASMDYCEERGARQSFLHDVRLGLLGEHQSRNAAVAIATIRRLGELGWAVPEQAIRAGIAAPRCPARIEVVSNRPLVVLDVAHNTASMAALMSVLDEQLPECPRTMIFAASQDKDVRGMLELVIPDCDRLILTRFCSNPRSVPTSELQAIVDQIRSSGRVVPDVLATEEPQTAWQMARRLANVDDLICISGSFFLAAEMRPLIRAQCVAGV